MIRTLLCLAVPASLFLLPGTATAQLPLSNAGDGRIVVGGIHLRPSNVEPHKKFWIDTLGGQPRRLANNFSAMFPGGIVEMGTPTFGCPQTAATSGEGACEQKPWAGSKGSLINHVGMSVPNLRAVVDRVKAAGYQVVTREELPKDVAAGEADGIAFRPDHKANVSLVMGPDNILVEFVEVASQKEPMVFHHLHFDTPEPAEMVAWYAKFLGARLGQGSGGQASTGASMEAVLPGAVLTFSPAPDVRAPTRGRVLDHLVFEIRNLDAYMPQLRAMGLKFNTPYYKPNLPLWGDWRSVFLTDPWGTYVELTEGAYKVK